MQAGPVRLHGMTDSEAFAGRLLGALTGAAELFTVELGRQLGLYRVLRGQARTPAGLARAADVDERYAREWLEQQAAAGILTHAGGEYALPEPVAAVLLDEEDEFYLGAAAEFGLGLGLLTPAVIEAFRTGKGITYADYGMHFRHGIAGFNRPMFRHLLAAEWLPAMPDVQQRLHRPGAHVLDLGCGVGHSSVALARAYPAVTVRGVDLDEASIAEARRNAAEAGVADRVTFTRADAAQLAGLPPADLVTVFEALHDMADPVAVLTAARGVLADGGSVFIGDERVSDTFTAPAGEVERLQYAFSVLHCLPATRAEGDHTANGTVLRAPTLLDWARRAGFTQPEVLDIANDFWRFYRLRG